MNTARILADEVYIPLSRPRRAAAPHGPSAVDRIHPESGALAHVPSPAHQLQAQVAAGIADAFSPASDTRFAPRISMAIIAGASLALWGGIALAVASIV
jgi:hypothetical protein